MGLMLSSDSLSESEIGYTAMFFLRGAIKSGSIWRLVCVLLMCRDSMTLVPPYQLGCEETGKVGLVSMGSPWAL